MLSIHGIGIFRPENIITNKFLEDLDIGTSNDWIMERVGIKTRRTVLDLDYIKKTKNANTQAAREASLYTNAQTGAKAAIEAVKNAGLKLEDIGMLISGCSDPQYNTPTEAATISAELGIEVPSIDLNSACSSIGAQFHFLNMMGGDLMPEYILLVNSENNTRAVDYSDRTASVLWGDCTTATVVSTKHASKHQVQNSFLDGAPSGNKKVIVERYGHFAQEGKTVQKFAIKKSILLLNHFRENIDPAHAENMKFIGHQANLLMLQSVCRLGEIKEENHYFNVDNYGNTGAAGAVSTLGENIHKLETGDNIVIGVVGAGLTWAGFHLAVK
ncbi:ketoacyl-ACP synthase III [bacterium]|nr:ketoacyl-ACP synthase III [bacterium]